MTDDSRLDVRTSMLHVLYERTMEYLRIRFQQWPSHQWLQLGRDFLLTHLWGP